MLSWTNKRRVVVQRCPAVPIAPNATPRSATESDIAGFAACSLDTNSAGAVRHPDSLYLEARKA